MPDQTNSQLVIRIFDLADEAAVVDLWQRCNLVVPWNDPHDDMMTKLAFQPDLFFVGELGGRVIASVMAGYEGHRGWINYLAVDPDLQRHGLGRQMMEKAEEALRALGCPKINLQVRETNTSVIGFYESIGYKNDHVLGFGKRILKPADQESAGLRPENIAWSYDQVARQYADKFIDEFDQKPFDRMILDRFAHEVRDLGPSCDLGCGPGEVARYLHRHGVDVFGIDLSPQMVEQARRCTPEIDFRIGNMLALPDADASLGSIAAFYSIIHISRTQVGQALGEMQRVLRPGGKLLLTFHIGSQVIHLDCWWEREVCVDFLFFQPKTMCAHLQAAGFEVLEAIEREPYPPEVEAQTRRAYILAQKPANR